MAHLHSLYDTDPHFTIDPVTREIKNMSGKVTIMQYDHNSERCTFEIPRRIDGHDMSLCNRVIVHWMNVDASTKDTNEDCYEVKDLQISPNSEDESVVILSWLISDQSTQYAGPLVFLIEFACTTGSTKDYAWHTQRHDGLSVGNGMNNGGSVVDRYSDVLLEWEQRLFGAGDSVMADIEEKAAEQMAAVEAKGAATLATIPEDYTELHQLANDAARTRANAIVQTVEGESVTAADCSGDYLRGLRIFGKSTQDGTPTPDAPVDIVSVGESGTVGVKVYGTNLVKNIQSSVTRNGVTIDVPGDGSIKISGTSTEGFGIQVNSELRLPDGVYFLTGAAANLTLTVWGMANGGWVSIAVDNGSGVSFTADASKYSHYLIQYAVQTQKTYNVTVYPMVNAGDAPLPWEAYKEEQTITIPRTLPGIPVSSGGNYTDANGQQWICDEVDLARGVYVQRVGKVTLTGEETHGILAETGGEMFVQLPSGFEAMYTNDLVTCKCNYYPTVARQDTFNNGQTAGFVGAAVSSTHIRITDNVRFNGDHDALNSWIAEKYSEGDPVIFEYILATPTETPLSDAEINAFKALHSNYPNTTVLNDAGAWMEVAYNADTKLYFNNSGVALVDTVTRKPYQLNVVNGKLTLIELEV